MKENNNLSLDEEIEIFRAELNKLMESGAENTEAILQLSIKLDKLIIKYYEKQKYHRII